MKFLFFSLFFSVMLHAQTLTFGIFTYRSAEKIVDEYQPIADHISKELNISIVIKPLSQENLEEEVRAGNIDIIATNPTHYISLQKQGKTTGPIATLIKRYGEVITPYLGGVIITHVNSGIDSIEALRNKVIAIPGKKFLGGYQTQSYELFKAGLEIEKSAQTVPYENHMAVVKAVLSKKADAGFIRSGILEEILATKKLDITKISIINAQHPSNFAMKVSTALYPEWSIVAAKKLDVDTVSKIAVALYSYKNTQIGYDIISGFTIPGDYADIDVLARALRIPPYDHIPTFTLEDIWSKYGMYILILASLTTLFFALLLFFYHKARFKKKYVQSILNATPSPIIVTDGTNLVDANMAFLNFVGHANIQEFKKRYNCICELFEDGDTNQYLHANMDEKTWIEHIISNPQQEHRAKITIHTITKIFSVYVSVVQYKSMFRAIAVFEDISQLLNQSTIDTLTGIANRTHFNLLFEHSLSIARRENNPMSLIFFDIDHFKSVNDTYGHLVGDDVLRHIANLVKRSLRTSDIFARWGGEEFVIILPNTTIRSTCKIAENLRVRIQEEEFATVQHISCSFGATQLKENEDKSTLLLRLDELLYIAKKNGRNRVELG